MRTFKVVPGTYVYPCINLDFIGRVGKFGVGTLPIKTLDEPWYFTDGQYKFIFHTDIPGLGKYGHARSKGNYYFVKLPTPTERVLALKIPENGTVNQRFKIYAFYVHTSRVNYTSS